MIPGRISPADIAKGMGLTESEAWKHARNIDKHFLPTREQQCGKKVRKIDAPKPHMKKLLKKLHRWMHQENSAHPKAHGGVSRRSPFTSARRHVSKIRNVWTRDAKDCFPSINGEMFCRELRQLGFRQDTAKLLTMLCIVRDRIPQGSPVSNDALNIYLWSLDQTMSSKAGNENCEFTRVADDLVLSSPCNESGNKLCRDMEDLLREKGLKINQKKRKKEGFQNRSKPQHVHSIRVDKRKGTEIHKNHQAVAWELAERYVSSCKCLQPDSLQATADIRKRLEGYMHYSRQAIYSNVKHLRKQLELGDRIVAKKLKAIRITAHKGKWWAVSVKRNKFGAKIVTRDEPKRIAAVWRQRQVEKSKRDRMIQLELSFVA